MTAQSYSAINEKGEGVVFWIMSKKRNAGSFRHMFSSFVYGVLVMPNDKYGSW